MFGFLGNLASFPGRARSTPSKRDYNRLARLEQKKLEFAKLQRELAANQADPKLKETLFKLHRQIKKLERKIEGRPRYTKDKAIKTEGWSKGKHRGWTKAGPQPNRVSIFATRPAPEAQILLRPKRFASPVPKPAQPPSAPQSEAAKEAAYLKKYPDVANAVRAGVFKTGKEHWLKHGQREGRVFGGWVQRPGHLRSFF